MRNKLSSTVCGMIFVLAGVAFLGNAFNWWNFDLFFDGWWTLFIIIPCILSVVRNGFNTGSIIGLGIGLILLLAAQDVFSYVNIWKLIVPLVLVAIGFSIIFKGSMNKSFYKQITTASKDGVPDITALFGENSPAFNNIPFAGCTANAIFGGVELNLRNAIISEDCVITASAIFGGIEIFLPYNVNVKVNATPFFGGIDDKSVPCTAMDAPTVYINATCIFGGADIK